MFIVTKIWRSGFGDVLKEVKTQLERLQLEYIDLYLIHWPIPTFDHSVKPAKPTTRSLEQIWVDMEKLVELGLVRNIGVSNCPCALLANLLANCKIPPCMN